MRLYTPMPTERHQWVQPADQDDFDAVYRLDGTSRVDGWRPVPVVTLDADERGNAKAFADLPFLAADAIVCRDGALGAVRAVLGGAGEFLEMPLADGSDRTWLFNVTVVADALDEERSDLVRFSTGRVMVVKRAVFRREVVRGLTAFRVPQDKQLLLSGDAVDALNATGLAGTTYELVWTDE